MTYLDEAYRRMKLPIFVAYLGGIDEYLVLSRAQMALPEQCWLKTSTDATRAYLKAVNELGGM